MGSKIECFWIEPADVAQETLRRYAGDKSCPGKFGYHNASVDIGTIHWETLTIEPTTGRRTGGFSRPLNEERKADARWPKTCECGYVFQPEDNWQWMVEQLHKDSKGAIYNIRNAPVGAMWDAWWFEERWMGPDGIHLMVQTPGGEWLVDGPAKNMKTPWSRTGKIPKVTAHPSIHIVGTYHGWLRDGFLVEC